MAMAAAVMTSQRNARSRPSHYNSRFADDYALRNTYLDDDHDGPNLCWLLIFFVVGGAFLSTGFHYAYSSFYDPRQATVLEYNRYVYEWNVTHRAELEKSAFFWRVVSPLPTPTLLPAVTCPPRPPTLVTCLGACDEASAKGPAGDVTEKQAGVCAGRCWQDAGMMPCMPSEAREILTLAVKDPYSEEAQAVPWQPFTISTESDAVARGQRTDDVATYEPYSLLISGVLPSDPHGSWDYGKWTGPPYTIEIKAESGGVERAFLLRDVALLEEVYASANQKMCRVHHNNNWHDGACWDRHAVESVCMNLNYSAAGGWDKGTGVGGPDGPFGCWVSAGGAPDHEIKYAPWCPGTKTILSQFTETCDFSKLEMRIRSAFDPHVRLYTLTDGTFNFGQTPTENWRQGIILICVGAFLYLPLAPIIIIKCSNRRNRRLRDNRAASHMFDDFGGLASTPPHPPTRRGEGYRDYDDDEYDDGVPASGSRAERYAYRPDTPPLEPGTYVNDLPGEGGGGGGKRPPGTYVRDMPPSP